MKDSNLRPLGYEPNALPTAPTRDVKKLLVFTDFCFSSNIINIMKFILYLYSFHNDIIFRYVIYSFIEGIYPKELFIMLQI